MSNIKRTIKRIYRLIHRLIVKSYIFINGKANTLLWIIKERKNDKIAISKCGINEMIPLFPDKWHYGTAFFRGKINNKTVFIKKVKDKGMALREISFYEYIRNNNSKMMDYIPEFYSSTTYKAATYIVTNFLDWNSLKEVAHNSLTIDRRCEIVLNLYRIYMLLRESKYAHNDIRLENFFENNGKIKLFDFGYSINYEEKKSLVDEVPLVQLKKLNDQNRPSDYYLDDAFSMMNIMKKINPELYLVQKNIWSQMNGFTGEIEVSIEKAAAQ